MTLVLAAQPQNQAQVAAQFVNSNPNNFATPCNAPQLEQGSAHTDLIFSASATYPAGTYSVTSGGETKSTTQASPLTGTALATAIAGLSWSTNTVTNPSNGVVRFVISAAGPAVSLSWPGPATPALTIVQPNGALPTPSTPSPTTTTNIGRGDC